MVRNIGAMGAWSVLLALVLFIGWAFMQPTEPKPPKSWVSDYPPPMERH